MLSSYPSSVTLVSSPVDASMTHRSPSMPKISACSVNASRELSGDQTTSLSDVAKFGPSRSAHARSSSDATSKTHRSAGAKAANDCPSGDSDRMRKPGIAIDLMSWSRADGAATAVVATNIAAAMTAAPTSRADLRFMANHPVHSSQTVRDASPTAGAGFRARAQSGGRRRDRRRSPPGSRPPGRHPRRGRGAPGRVPDGRCRRRAAGWC